MIRRAILVALLGLGLAAQAGAQITLDHYRAGDGTAYTVLRAKSSMPTNADSFRVTTIGGSTAGSGSCVLTGAGSGDPVAAIGGPIPPGQTLHPFGSVTRSPIFTPDDIDTINFTSDYGGKVVIGSGGGGSSVCHSAGDCSGAPNVQTLYTLDSSTGAPAACSTVSANAACDGSTLRSVFAFGIPETGNVCDDPGDITGSTTICGAEPADGIELATGEAIVFVFNTSLALQAFQVSYGGFYIDGDGDSACGANEVLNSSSGNDSQGPLAGPTDTPTPTATGTVTQTPTVTGTPTPDYRLGILPVGCESFPAATMYCGFDTAQDGTENRHQMPLPVAIRVTDATWTCDNGGGPGASKTLTIQMRKNGADVAGSSCSLTGASQTGPCSWTGQAADFAAGDTMSFAVSLTSGGTAQFCYGSLYYTANGSSSKVDTFTIWGPKSANQTTGTTTYCGTFANALNASGNPWGCIETSEKNASMLMPFSTTLSAFYGKANTWSTTNGVITLKKNETSNTDLTGTFNNGALTWNDTTCTSNCTLVGGDLLNGASVQGAPNNSNATWRNLSMAFHGNHGSIVHGSYSAATVNGTRYGGQYGSGTSLSSYTNAYFPVVVRATAMNLYARFVGGSSVANSATLYVGSSPASMTPVALSCTTGASGTDLTCSDTTHHIGVTAGQHIAVQVVATGTPKAAVVWSLELSDFPTDTPTPIGTSTVTQTPTITDTPTNTPTATPTSTPTATRTFTPTWTPLNTFTPEPTSTPGAGGAGMLAGNCCCCGGLTGGGSGGAPGPTPIPPLFATGCYVGSGSDDRVLATGMAANLAGFTKICEQTAQAGNSGVCVFRVPEMGADVSCAMANSDLDPSGSYNNCGANNIQSYETNYTVVGTSSFVNGAGPVYCYSQWGLDPDTHGTFSYLGDGTGNRTITTTAQPAMVFLVENNTSSTTDNIPWIRTANMPLNTSYPASQFATTGDTTHIRGFSATSFDVGSSFNENSKTYYGAWWAEGAYYDAGYYNGNGTSLASGTCASINDIQTIATACSPVRDVWLATSQTHGENGGTCTSLSRADYCPYWRSAATDVDVVGPGSTNVSATNFYAFHSTQPNNSGPGLIGQLVNQTFKVTGGANLVPSCNDNGRTYYYFSTCADGPTINEIAPGNWAFDADTVASYEFESESAGDDAINLRNSPIGDSGTALCGYPDCDLADTNTVARSTTIKRTGSQSAQFTAASSQVLSCTLDGSPNCAAYDLGGSGTSFSVGAFFYASTDVASTILSVGPALSQVHYILKRNVGGTYTWSVTDSLGTLKSKTSATTVAAGQWANVVGVFDNAGDVIELYVNSASQGTTAITNDAFTDTGAVTANMGQDTSSGAGYADGYLDDVAVTAAALDATEICRWCSCGFNGSLCSCFADDPTVYVNEGLNASLCGSCTLPACDTAGY